MIMQAFFETGINSIPEFLEPRERSKFYLMGFLLFASFVLIAFAKKENGRFPQMLMQLITYGGNLDQRLKESIRPGSTVSILLNLNYLLVFALCCYLSLSFLGAFDESIMVLLSVALPIVLMAIQSLPVFLAKAVTGVSIPVNTIIANNFIGGQISGIVMLILAMIWSLNPAVGGPAIVLFVILIGATQLLRLFKNSLVLLGVGVRWYYILLYFCTLEILPLFVAYYYVTLNFSI